MRNRGIDPNHCLMIGSSSPFFNVSNASFDAPTRAYTFSKPRSAYTKRLCFDVLLACAASEVLNQVLDTICAFAIVSTSVKKDTVITRTLR